MSTLAAINPLVQSLTLPASFLGDAAVVALAFSLPALVAGLWVGTASVLRRIGGRTVAMVAGSLVVGIGFAVALQVAAPPTDMTSLVRAALPR